MVDTNEGTALYVGPAFSYYEVVTEGNETTPATRLADAEWRQMLLEGNPFPAAPAWTASFRIPTSRLPEPFSLLRQVEPEVAEPTPQPQAEPEQEEPYPQPATP